jgi:hypothetical protein
MKIRLALATVALSLLTAASAHAALPVTVSVTGTGDPMVFDFSLTNTSGSAITVDEISLSPFPTGARPFEDDLFNGVPPSGTGGIVLNSGGGSYSSSFTYSAGDVVPTSASDISLVAKSAGVVVGAGGPAAVPEPGSVALLVGSTMGGGLLLARRRRK